MFSVIIIAQTFNRQTYIYNSIFAAAFVILAYDPFLIFSVGFQLSFLAVLGIVYLTPKIDRLVETENRILDWMWKIASVSIAAQVAAMPLSVYYFNQAPVYFLAANMIVVPAAGIILITGIVLLGFGRWEWLGEWSGKILEICIRIMNESVMLIERLPGSKIFPLEISGIETLSAYGLIFFLLAAFHTRKFHLIVMAGLCLIMFMTIETMKLQERSKQKKIIFYRIPGQAAIDFVKGKSSYLYADLRLFENNETLGYRILPFHIAHGLPVKNLKTLNLQSYRSAGYCDAIVFEGKKLVYIKKTANMVSFGEPVTVDFLVIGNDAVTDLQQVCNRFLPQMIIIDTTNDADLSLKLYRQSQELNLNCITLDSFGAQVIEL